MCVCVYFLSAGHPAADGRHEHGAQQDLSRMVDQQGNGDQREMLVACKHNLQHGNTCRRERVSEGKYEGLY